MFKNYRTIVKKDILFSLALILLFLPFFISNELYEFYREFNHDHGLIMAFIKFGILATLGEMIGLRIKTGNYYSPNFGLLSRIMVWGFLGIGIKIAFVIFASGTPLFLEYLGLEKAVNSMTADFSNTKLWTAFSISLAMNLIFAPVMMTLHRITDLHIEKNKGVFSHFFKDFTVSQYFRAINWDVQWGFVFKKTIPFFWIPAHTITFLLPVDMQVLFAAFLGVILGVILAFASKS